MKRTVIFLGPSAPADMFTTIADVELRPPVGQGDVFRAVHDGAERIAIVDGYFDSTPAVLHKEIVWAMNQGVSVLGAASMGALRAAELHAFGMIGLGWIYEAFASGRLEDDDEVAIIHAPARLGFFAVSEAMVNIRRTMERAVVESRLSTDEAETFVSLAKGSYYADREWPRLLKEARTLLPATTIDRLEAWLPEGRVDIKREDALQLAHFLSSSTTTIADAAPSYEHTRLVEAVRQGAVRKRASVEEREETRKSIAFWRERRVSGPAHELLALVDVLLAELARLGGTDLDDAAVVEAANAWRHAAGLHGKDGTEAWLAEHGLRLEHLLRVLERDARLIQARNALGPLIDDYLVERLRFHHGQPDGTASEGRKPCAALDWYRPGLDIPSALG
ncbi:TfuA-like protein [Sphingobium nicotianae]|uniref:TfuA-like core domain-containing protein n=1 Tax=Sphingobium nicotianae TaxID=2782607 RepID=A0A9X1DD75_9SPHN|nr:TfuA-like protein [Sphingobium nicotianae]MBT2188035.1 hypothetical protein [Sphingobium nicotianae]